MSDQKCTNCSALKACQYDKRAWIFIIVGLIATLSIRLVTILMNVSKFWGELAWYIGVSGFIVFFMYKYRVFKERADLINRRNLIVKFERKEPLDEEDYKEISKIFCHIQSNRERINFLFIFVTSIISLVIAIYLDFFR